MTGLWIALLAAAPAILIVMEDMHDAHRYTRTGEEA